MPGGGQRAGLGFAVADDAGDDQFGIVERGPEGMADRISQLAPFVDRPRRLRRNVAGNPSRKGELLEQFFQTGLILADVGIDLAVRPFEVDVADHRRCAVAGAGDVDHVEVMLLDDPVQMRVNEVLSGGRPPVPEQQLFDVLELQRLAKQRIFAEINLADRKVIGGAPVGVRSCEAVRRRADRFCPEIPRGLSSGTVPRGLVWCLGGSSSLWVAALAGSFVRICSCEISDDLNS